ncbi:MAG: helix-hairpin-helix domain-containing protein [Pelobium sp.]
MYQKFKQYFELSRREFRGMIVFVVILVIVYVAPYIYEKLTFEPMKISIETLEPKIAEIEKFDQQSENKSKNFEEESSIPDVTMFYFNPNNLPLEDWIKLGLSEKQARIIKNYEAKGGKFRSKADVKKMYTISEKQYQKLAPFIQLQEEAENSNNFQKEESQNSFKPYTKSEPVKIVIDINTADSATLTTIRGIGPAFASRIAKYRNGLGGFYTIDQLKEIYGIDSTKFDQIKDQVKIDEVKLRLIKINECSFEELKTFPYLSYK